MSECRLHANGMGRAAPREAAQAVFCVQLFCMNSMGARGLVHQGSKVKLCVERVLNFCTKRAAAARPSPVTKTGSLEQPAAAAAAAPARGMSSAAEHIKRLR